LELLTHPLAGVESGRYGIGARPHGRQIGISLRHGSREVGIGFRNSDRQASDATFPLYQCTADAYPLGKKLEGTSNYLTTLAAAA
jgi:hypothetical protein